MQNHIIDPSYFYDAIEMFAFDYDWYVVSGTSLDDMGRRKLQYTKSTIRGSLQSQGTRMVQSNQGNTEDMSYEFYCKSLYRINKNDFIWYKDRWLIVEAVRDFDEWGVRSATLKMTNLNNHKDFAEWLKYLNGQVIV